MGQVLLKRLVKKKTLKFSESSYSTIYIVQEIASYIKVENEMYTGGEIIGKKYRLKILKKIGST